MVWPLINYRLCPCAAAVETTSTRVVCSCELFRFFRIKSELSLQRGAHDGVCDCTPSAQSFIPASVLLWTPEENLQSSSETKTALIWFSAELFCCVFMWHVSRMTPPVRNQLSAETPSNCSTWSFYLQLQRLFTFYLLQTNICIHKAPLHNWDRLKVLLKKQNATQNLINDILFHLCPNWSKNPDSLLASIAADYMEGLLGLTVRRKTKWREPAAEPGSCRVEKEPKKNSYLGAQSHLVKMSLIAFKAFIMWKNSFAVVKIHLSK